jgi:hypothetical protein
LLDDDVVAQSDVVIDADDIDGEPQARAGLLAEQLDENDG